ncbi:hypothetical protein BDZ88DRAFT_62029 [Geranomyces variabilis]|nr:hypothetical protein BDZ88DRAFT_62029 [Geranomyces variabilis]KAJ3131020.1 hypothetical protein HDU90_009201 [Geranomyces variabilis]
MSLPEPLSLSNLVTDRPEGAPLEPSVNEQHLASYHQNFDFALGHYTLSCKYNGPEEGFVFPHHPDDMASLTQASSPIRAAISQADNLRGAALSVGRLYREKYSMFTNTYEAQSSVTCFAVENNLILTSHDILPRHLAIEYYNDSEEYRFFVIWQAEWSEHSVAPFMTPHMVTSKTTASLRRYVKPVDEVRPFATLFKAAVGVTVPPPIKLGYAELSKPLRELSEKEDRAPFRISSVGFQSDWGMDKAMKHYEALPVRLKNAIPPPSSENFMRSCDDALSLSPGHILAERTDSQICRGLPDAVYLQVSVFVTSGCCGSPVLLVDSGDDVVAVGLIIGGSVQENHNLAISFNDPLIRAMIERNKLVS